MATISDELATSIQKCFNQTYTDLANQQSFLFGSGDVTINKPDGSKGTVRSWNKLIEQIDPVIKNGALTNQETTFEKKVTFKGQIFADSIELTSSIPYIDFHRGNSTKDYTHRLIADEGQFTVMGCNFGFEQNIFVKGWTDSRRTIRSYDSLGFLGMDDKDPSGGTGSVLAAPRYSSRFPTRGADSNGPAGAHFWFEEYAGYNHKAVISVQGYSAQLQYFQFLNDGQIQGNRGYVQWAGTSDINYKKEVKATDGEKSLDNICKMKLVTFIYKDDEQGRVRRGVIAQQIRTIDEVYVKESELTYQQGDEVITQAKLVLDSNPLLMDALAAIQVLAKRVEELEKRSL
ncbi:tail fiber domain-containing protein [Pluralibacter gergoviae]|uniref:Tail fiber domain-containing protein n=1 Tax=Pluralibacter gergoviae TaxID=61647 RepID=A0AAI9DGV5_PLUGE|nr:tail fiber domain-containing protein [Pluralibacter gergoviae]EKV0913216.1 tail fiber domain-containing protein [Pluralibacter gergoviae]EKW6617944.1 tail fiber domain-containing protein [Pluralibacter gergoviae]EKW7272450.1 tail fiber domain-containing protein [Pluralibacter gergoviae]EKW9974109.1 tail fiber domain-containing protein [Pluralibacter gergoviae]ELD4293925.1 tail fiber domain-containing protein [Pluralibacter gergoviae]